MNAAWKGSPMPGAVHMIVAGVDESEGAAAGLRWAVREGRLHGAKVAAVMAWGFLDQHHTIVGERFDPSYVEDDALDVLRTLIAAAVGDDAATVDARVVCGLPARALLDVAAGADLLVVGASGLGGFRGLLLGSVSQHCLHHTTTPIAIIRDGRERDGQHPERIVVGIDGSDTAQRALRWALNEARARNAALEVVHAWQVPYAGYVPHTTGVFDPEVHEHAARQLIEEALAAEDTSELQVPVKRAQVRRASAAILDAAQDADLLVMGSRGLGGWKGMLLGSVTLQAVHHAPCPVVVVPPAR